MKFYRGQKFVNNNAEEVTILETGNNQLIGRNLLGTQLAIEEIGALVEIGYLWDARSQESVTHTAKCSSVIGVHAYRCDCKGA